MPITITEVVQIVIEIVKLKDAAEQEKARLEQEVLRLREMLKNLEGGIA